MGQKIQLSMQNFWDSSEFNAGSQAYLEQEYERFLQAPNAVEVSLQECFLKLANGHSKTEVLHSVIQTQFKNFTKNNISAGANTELPDVNKIRKQAMVHDLINNYRLLGHLYSDINPLRTGQAIIVPELESIFYHLEPGDLEIEFDAGALHGAQQRKLKQIIHDLKTVYCGSIASEFMHIPDSPERMWVQDQIESIVLNTNYAKDIQTDILKDLIAADGLEKYLAAKYPGAKRFSLEGSDSLLVGLNKLIHEAGCNGMQEIVIGMAHRGRINVLVNTLGKNPKDIFDEFEGKHSKEIELGDVKYHQGFSSDIATKGGNVHLALVFNPSHLEIVIPVMCGSVRARQEKRLDHGRTKVLPIAIHGDSAIAGQGVVMETFNMSQTPGYGVGGTIHIIVNNQIGFTTSDTRATRSTLYCSDIGKMMLIPIFHVNANDPEAVFTVAKIALDYRNKFNKDVIIDLIGYRRMGHNEADEPSVTQPLMYKMIKDLPTLVQIYSQKLIALQIFTAEEIQAMIAKYKQLLDERDKAVARNLVGNGWKNEFSSDWSKYASTNGHVAVKTSIGLDELKKIAISLGNLPSKFNLHPRLKKILDDRAKMTSGDLPIDWGYAETIAYATILVDGYKIRLSGQDSSRGTFFHRHAIFHDQVTGDQYIPLNHLDAPQGKFQVIDSLLSEAGVLGFDYGYSTNEPHALVIWEAQFGDFANGAQVVIDQFISSGEQKWGRLSGLTMLLPHGYEGQGAEHSSARLERYLQLCARQNMQVCIPSTPAQIYHLLRRQVLRPLRKPLIVFTPKSLLRHKMAVSSFSELANGSFLPIIADPQPIPNNIQRIILCTGKIYYELEGKRLEEKNTTIAIIRLEQLYPFPVTELKAALKKYPGVKEVIWCQEEPKNQGSWYSIQHRIKSCLEQNQSLQYAGREAAAAPAVGYINLHTSQQKQIVIDAFGDK